MSHDIEFTGERFIPGHGGPQLAYEHWHRYLYARRWARGADVLDLATGAGYGAALLAATARHVWALDLDAAALARARAAHADVSFLRADVSRLPFAAARMDLVVALEVLEHVDDPEQLIREAARVVRPGGVVLVSTPNKSVYTDARDYRNPFHRREFYRDEFRDLLRQHFRWVQIVEQQVRAGSLITAGETPGGGSEIFTRPLTAGGTVPAAPMYFVAVCAPQQPPGILPPDSAYLDPSDALFEEGQRRLEQASTEIEKLNAEIRDLGNWAQALGRQVEELQECIGLRDQTIRELQQEMAQEIASRDEGIRRLQADCDGLRRDFDERGQWAQSLAGDVAARDETIRRTQAELENVSGHLLRIRQAFVYRMLRRLGLLPQ
jgi:hypothetical protein